MSTKSYGTLKHKRLDITVIDKKNKRAQLIDTLCPPDSYIKKKEEQKCINYNQVKYEIARMWKIKQLDV